MDSLAKAAAEQRKKVTIHDSVRTYIVNELRVRVSETELRDDFPLLDKEVLDSMGIFQVVAFLEDEYGIEVDDTDLVPENFETIDSIARLVETRLGS